jgi:hypothetical protein
MTTRLVLLAALVASACVEGEPEVGSSSAEVAVTWTNLVRVSATGNDLTKTNLQESWNAGAVTVEALEGDGYVEFTTGESNSAKMVGLSVGDAGVHWTDIDFAMFLRANGAVGVYEAGVERGNSLVTYSAGDLFRIEANDGVVTYSVNGTVFYTSPTAPPVRLRVDTSLRSPGATVLDVDLVSTPLSWQNAVGVTVDADGTGLTKTVAGTTWSAGAATVETISGDGFVEFTTAENDTAKMVGLSSGDTNQHWTDIDFAIYLKANGTIAIAEAGVQRSGFGTYVTGDSFRIEVQGGVVYYSVNGGPPFHTSAAAPAPVLLVDTSLSTPGATVRNVRLTAAGNACPAYSGVGAVCVGTFTVTNSVDLEEIAGCSEITGNLIVSAPGMTVIALPALERVSGSLEISGNTDLSRLQMPALKEVGGQLYLSLYDLIAGIDLSRLRSAGSILINPPAGATEVDVNFGCLQTTGEVSAAGLVRAVRLQTIEGDATAFPLDAPALTEVTGTFNYTDGTNVPALEHAGSVILLQGSTVSMPSLAAVDGRLVAGDVFGPEGGCQSTALTATSLELPALTQIGALHLCWPGLEELSLPELQVIDGPVVGGTVLYIRSTSQTTPFELPALTEIEGPASLFAATSMPVLERVSGPFVAGGKLIVSGPMDAPELLEVANYGLDLRAPFSAPALTAVGRTVTLNGISAVSLPALVTVGAITTRGTSLIELDLAALTTVTGTGVFITQTSLASLSLPALQTIAGNLAIRNNNSMTSLSMPLLNALGPTFTIVGNDILPNCYAINLRDDLVAAGWTGTWSISGNGTGSCPP